MTETSNSKPYDLEPRTLLFAQNVRTLVKGVPRTIASFEDGRQLVRASGSVGANYIEANEALSKKDFRMRIKICRKEAKEARYWLRLLDLASHAKLDEQRTSLVAEATELLSIFSAIEVKTR